MWLMVTLTGSQCQITPPGSLLQLEDNVMASFDDTPAAVVNLTGNLSLIEDPRTSLAASTSSWTSCWVTHRCHLLLLLVRGSLG
jgi:hypothetical protein